MVFVQKKSIVLKCLTINESDVLVTVLTEDGHKVCLIAKGAKKSKRRFVGGIFDAANVIEITYRQTLNPPFFVEEAKLINSFLFLRSKYEKLMAALNLLKLIDKIAVESGSDQIEIYKILGNSLKSLEKVNDLECFKLHYLTKILNFLGILDSDTGLKVFVKTPILENFKIKIDHQEIVRNLYRLRQSLEEFSGLSHVL